MSTLWWSVIYSSHWIDKMLSSLIFAAMVQASSTTPTVFVFRNTSLSAYSTLISESLKSWPSAWVMVSLCLAYGIGSHWKRRNTSDLEDTTGKHVKKNIRGLNTDDPPLLQKHSTYKTYTTSSYTYSGIRTFYHPHPQADKLPKESGPLPILVFIHGLGGCVAQFTSLLSTVFHVGPCLAIDLPGCGVSDLSPLDWKAYTHEALADLLEVAIQQLCDATQTQEVILIGHSMGCSLAVTIALSKQRQVATAFRIKGLIAICPQVSRVPTDKAKVFRRLLNIPSPIFNAWRKWDARGGIASESVTRLVGKDAHVDTKKLQVKFNRQSRTETFRRIAMGALPGDESEKRLPGPEDWGRLSLPLLAVAGDSDIVTSPKEIEIIVKALGKDKVSSEMSTEPGLDSRSTSQSTSSELTMVSSGDEPGRRNQLKTGSVLKTTILPAPASHGLMYDLTTYRTLSGLMQDFMTNHIDHRLSPGWQLQRMKESNKWDVKNLAKWQAVVPVSASIANVFHAMKTLREVDDVHSPKAFTDSWNKKIRAVIDMSYENPTYSSQGLEDGGVEYHKLPTVSKIPPTVDEVQEFISIVDQLRDKSDDDRLIGVHCHYGYNRTGFFICTYLVERLGYSVQSAIDEFQTKRPPGIRHEHFLDTLFVRYCVGLKRAPTL